jgi:FlaA1/EpsC-like NDP-sugar epimerase
MIDQKIDNFIKRGNENNFDFKSIKYKNKKILITGAAGSIGYGLCKQISKINPKLLIAVDCGETELFYSQLELRDEYPGNKIVFKILDIKDEIGVESLLKEYQPDMIFHAAAYKHISMLEGNPREAILNNVLGTKNLIESANRNKITKFINISTDKAADPISVMGCSKRVTEKMLISGNFNKTKIIQVRFGNIIGSRGSVLPIFQQQILKGGPITITDDRMVRYFITVDEAVYLLLHASKIGENKQIYLLEMGEPVKIIDLADKLIRAYGFTPGKNFRVSITGKKPGEKYTEELFCKKSEIIEKTPMDKINVVKNVSKIPASFQKEVDDLIKYCQKNTDTNQIRKKLFKLAKD